MPIPVAVLNEAQPVLDALQRLHIDVGSIKRNRVEPDAPPEWRCLCIATAEPVDHIASALRNELAGQPEALALTDNVAALSMPLGTTLIIFLDVVALAVEL
jgi:hypothetical protein